MVKLIHTLCMLLLRLRGRKICDKVIAKGNVWKGKHMMVRWLPGAPFLERNGSGDATALRLYMGTLASTRLHKSAVKRNRMRRRCKEAFRLALKDIQSNEVAEGSPSTGSGLPGGALLRERRAHERKTVGFPFMNGSFQLLVTPRSSSLSCAFGDIQVDVRRFLSSLP